MARNAYSGFSWWIQTGSADCPNLKYIYIPKSTTSIDPTAFDNVSGLTILGKTGSSAENFAAANGFVFKVSP